MGKNDFEVYVVLFNTNNKYDFFVSNKLRTVQENKNKLGKKYHKSVEPINYYKANNSKEYRLIEDVITQIFMYNDTSILENIEHLLVKTP